MYQISKEFVFSAAHHLPHLPEGHQCRRPHGHNYVVRVTLRAEHLDENSFVVDYGDLSALKEYIDETLDHQDLNEVFPGMRTTAERLAYHLFNKCKGWWPQTYAVAVSETQKTWAEYSE